MAAENLVGVYRGNGFWMTWNLFLAFIPAVLAPLVFRHRGDRTPLWWTGLALFALFLPNAPYVITDLVHLDGDVRAAADDTAVLTGVLPVYAVFIALGVLAYTFSVMEVGRYVDRIGLAARRLPIELGIHFMAAVGVVLGRFARLNSWEPVTEPHSTAERIVLTLTWPWAIVMAVCMFVVIWVGHAATRSLGLSAGRALAALGGRLWAAVEHHLGLRPL